MPNPQDKELQCQNRVRTAFPAVDVSGSVVRVHEGNHRWTCTESVHPAQALIPSGIFDPRRSNWNQIIKVKWGIGGGHSFKVWCIPALSRGVLHWFSLEDLWAASPIWKLPVGFGVQNIMTNILKLCDKHLSSDLLVKRTAFGYGKSAEESLRCFQSHGLSSTALLVWLAYYSGNAIRTTTKRNRALAHVVPASLP